LGRILALGFSPADVESVDSDPVEAVRGVTNTGTATVASLAVVDPSANPQNTASIAFTNASAWVEDQSTVNRATLHIAPLVVVWIFVGMRAWLEDARTRAAGTAAA